MAETSESEEVEPLAGHILEEETLSDTSPPNDTEIVYYVGRPEGCPISSPLRRSVARTWGLPEDMPISEWGESAAELQTWLRTNAPSLARCESKEPSEVDADGDVKMGIMDYCDDFFTFDQASADHLGAAPDEDLYHSAEEGPEEEAVQPTPAPKKGGRISKSRARFLHRREEAEAAKS